MPVGGDLGFSYLVLLVVVVPVIGLFVRRKWRILVARSEEIKRLLVLAEEEAARAELEASTYGASAVAIDRPLEYQCEVCFCPTTTRCARCKAVRYCSGKCQIIHWRQGHKEECRPFTTSHQINDVGGGSSQKVLKQQEDEIYGHNFEESARSKSNCFPEVFGGNDDSEVECLADGEGTNSSSDETEISGGYQRTNIFPNKLETNCVYSVDQNGLPSSKQTTLVSVDCLSSGGKLNQLKPNCTDHNIQYRSSSSSGLSAENTNSLYFGPSKPSSGFWEGSINSSRPKIVALDDSAQSGSSGTGGGNVHNSRSSQSSSFNFDRNSFPPVNVQVSDPTTSISDGARSTTLGTKKLADKAISSEEITEDASKGRSSPLPNKSNHMDAYSRSDSPVSKSGELRYTSSSNNPYLTSSVGGPSINTHFSKDSGMRYLSPERSKNVVNGTRTTSQRLDSKKDGSLSSSSPVSHLSSTSKHSPQGAKSGKDDNANSVAANSSAYARYSPNAGNGLKTSMQKVDQLKAPKSSQHYKLGVGGEIFGRYNNKGLFPFELFVKLYNWNKIELQPCGLTNCGNSCYANAVLQCLAFTPPLTAYLLQGLHSEACEMKGWCFTCEFQSLVLKSKEGTSPLSPIGILSQIQKIGSHLGNGREEDAHEFLRYAIDTMQSVCLKEAGVNTCGPLEEETTLIGLTFGGYLRSKIKCMKCEGKSERHERMMDLTVEIEGDIETLEEALQQFTGTEILDGENKYHCSRCRSYERAKKKLTVLEAPNILTIALKRFQSGKFGKLNKLIRFPEILDLAPYMSGTSDKSPIYRLYGVVVHLDIMNAAFSGHYVCYVKNVQSKWFKIDDSTVEAVELGSVLTKGAYMLLYARCSPRAPRLIRNSIIAHDPRKSKNPISKSRSHSTGPWDASSTDSCYGQTSFESFYPSGMSFQSARMVLEDESSSDNSSSIFSEDCSGSTESSNRDSTSTDDYFDPFLGDEGCNWNSVRRNLSDSDLASSSSSPSLTPLYSRHSPLANSDLYSSGYPETSGCHDHSFWTEQPSRSSNSEGKASVTVLYSDTSKQCTKLESSSNCRETDSVRLRPAYTFDSMSLSSRRSTREPSY